LRRAYLLFIFFPLVKPKHQTNDEKHLEQEEIDAENIITEHGTHELKWLLKEKRRLESRSQPTVVKVKKGASRTPFTLE
jgi:hypothetical protein